MGFYESIKAEVGDKPARVDRRRSQIAGPGQTRNIPLLVLPTRHGLGFEIVAGVSGLRQAPDSEDFGKAPSRNSTSGRNGKARTSPSPLSDPQEPHQPRPTPTVGPALGTSAHLTTTPSTHPTAEATHRPVSTAYPRIPPRPSADIMWYVRKDCLEDKPSTDGQ